MPKRVYDKGAFITVDSEDYKQLMENSKLLMRTFADIHFEVTMFALAVRVGVDLNRDVLRQMLAKHDKADDVISHCISEIYAAMGETRLE